MQLLQHVKDLTLHPKNAKELKVHDGTIDFNSVAFGYGKKEKNVFSDLSIHIKPGEKVAFVGTS